MSSAKRSRRDERVYLEAVDIPRDPIAWFACNPPSPLCLVVSSDPHMGYVDVTPAAYFWVTYPPHSLTLRLNRYDFGADEHISDAYLNIRDTGEFVLAWPQPDLLEKVWIAGLPLPKGIDEMEVAGLTPVPSRHVRPPGIGECMVNLECKTLFVEDFYTVGLVVANVVGATVHRRMFEASARQAHPWWLYEVERPQEPYRLCAARMGDTVETVHDAGSRERTDPWVGSGTFREHLRDCKDRGLLSKEEFDKADALMKRWAHVYFHDCKQRDTVEKALAGVAHLTMFERWDELHDFIASVEEA